MEEKSLFWFLFLLAEKVPNQAAAPEEGNMIQLLEEGGRASRHL